MTTTEETPASTTPTTQELGPEQKGAFLRLALIIGVGVAIAVIADVAKTVAVVFALILMVMLHEAGHFFMAKRADMKVTEFFVGFGTKLWSVRRGETEYGVKAIPAGGYVKIVGMSNIEEVPPEEESRTYRQKGYWQRLGVAVAGSTVHFILALLLLWGLFAFVGQRNYDNPQPIVSEITKIESGPSPAEAAGFKVGDRLLSVDGTPITDWEAVRNHIKARPGQPIVFQVERGERAKERLTLTVVPANLQDVKVDGAAAVSEPTGFVGISPTPPLEKDGVVGGLSSGTKELWRYTSGTFVALGKIFSFQGMNNYVDAVRGKGDAGDDGDNRFLSPIGFVRVASQAADEGWAPVLSLLALINVFVGIFNMIPLLPFDGGHVAVATYEAIRSRKGKRYFVDGRKALATAYPVVMLLVFIAVTSLYLDLANPVNNPYR
jgi:membrane-associated protease RseP (regulator of RpoE activity)